MGLVTIGIFTVGRWNTTRRLPTLPPSQTSDKHRTTTTPSPPPRSTSAALPQIPTKPDHPLSHLFAGEALAVDTIEAAERMIADQTLKDHPGEVDAVVLKGLVLQYHGNSDGARPCFEKALEIDPGRADLYQKLGKIAQDRGDPNGAIQVWKRGLKDIPDAPGLRWHIANALANLGKHEEARNAVMEECLLTPEEPRNYYLLGQINSHLGEHQEARKNYEKTIRLKPDHHSAFYALGMLCRKLKERDLAKQYLSKSQKLQAELQSHLDEGDKMGDLGRAKGRAARLCWLSHKLYWKSNRHDVAEHLINKAAELDPKNPVYLERLALLAAQRHEFAEALRLYEAARIVDEDNILHYLNIGKLTARLNQLDKAEKTLLEAVSRFPESDLPYAAIARLYLVNKRYPSRVISLSQQAVDRRQSAANYFLLSRAHAANGDPAQALVAIKTAIKLDPTNSNYQSAHDHIKGKLSPQ